MKHENNGCCRKCTDIMARFPDFSMVLNIWFTNLQYKHPECHISEAGRGEDLQELYFMRGASNARYGESAHNYNAALDLFRQIDGKSDYSRKWFEEVVGGNLTKDIEWYGLKGSIFHELPHVELRGWKEKGLNLVEPIG